MNPCTYGNISPTDLEYQESISIDEFIFMDQLEEKEFKDWLKTCQKGSD